VTAHVLVIFAVWTRLYAWCRD